MKKNELRCICTMEVFPRVLYLQSDFTICKHYLTEMVAKIVAPSFRSGIFTHGQSMYYGHFGSAYHLPVKSNKTMNETRKNVLFVNLLFS